MELIQNRRFFDQFWRAMRLCHPEISNFGWIMMDQSLLSTCEPFHFLVGGWATPLKKISQLGWFFQIYGKITIVPNHQPVLLVRCWFLVFQSTIFINGQHDQHILLIRFLANCCFTSYGLHSWFRSLHRPLQPNKRWPNKYTTIFCRKNNTFNGMFTNLMNNIAKYQFITVFIYICMIMYV